MTTATHTEDNPRFHPLANAFPLLEADSPEFKELMEDIGNNGLMSPIVMFEGKILDGRNRWLACQALGIAHREVKFDDERDPISFVWSTNAVRRQLTAGQRAMAAEKLATASQGRPRKTVEGTTTTADMTIPEAAARTGASAGSIKKARKVRTKGVPAVVDAVERGELPVDPAARLAELPPEQQEEIMATTPVADVPKAVPDGRVRRTSKAAEPEPADATDDSGAVPPVVFQEPELEVPLATVTPLVTKTPGGNRRRPLTVLKDQLKASSDEGERSRLDFWTKHAGLIKDLPPAELDQFVKDMRSNVRNINALLKLIKENKGS